MTVLFYMALALWLSTWVVLYYIMQCDTAKRTSLSFLCLLLQMTLQMYGAVFLAVWFIYKDGQP